MNMRHVFAYGADAVYAGQPRIRMQVPEVEPVVFVHGALSIAYSGRCLLYSDSTLQH